MLPKFDIVYQKLCNIRYKYIFSQYQSYLGFADERWPADIILHQIGCPYSSLLTLE